MILRAHPERKVIEPMPNFYESAATSVSSRLTSRMVLLRERTRPAGSQEAWSMSALGQKQTLRFEAAMSAIPPKADIRRQG
jgi:hypothetical protein